MTIKEIAEKCGVSEQAIRAWCKKNDIPKSKQAEKTKASYLITSDVENRILANYSIGNIKNNEKQEIQQKEIKTSDQSNEKQEIKQKESDEKQGKQETSELQKELIRQLQEKDKQILALHEQNKLLIENNQTLTQALTTAQQSLQVEQTLHAATIHTTALVDKSDELERKWWQKIFKKKENI